MITVRHLSKTYHNPDGTSLTVLKDINCEIGPGEVISIIGPSGTGKSTFLRMAAGVLKPDRGTITIDGQPVFEEPETKKDFFYISDEMYFFPNSTPDAMSSFFERIYPLYDRERYRKLMSDFSLNGRRKINTFSKGMKKQLSIILGLSAMTKYMYCDETFDGLDPVMRQGVKSLFASDMADRGFTPVIASHNLRELEDICDTVGLLHQGGILLSEDLDEVKADIHKLHCVLPKDTDMDAVRKNFEILVEDKKGSVYTFTIRGNEDEIMKKINDYEPLFAEMLPLSLEEIFISETGVTGYDIKKFIS